ncbi:MAG: hypothetical protein IPO21_17770 [Bacteroidales bacterium]|nr:hypothetical protein [Bacteroidales bacterium]
MYAFCLFMLFSLNSVAQVELVKRIEIEEKDPGYKYSFFKHNDEAGFISYISENKSEKTYTFHFDKVDNAFNKKKSVEISIPKSFDNHMYASDTTKLYLLMYNFKKGKYDLRVLDKNKLEIVATYTGVFPKKAKLRNISAVNGKLVMVFGLKKFKETVMQILDPVTGNTKMIVPPVADFKRSNYKAFSRIDKGDTYELHLQYEIKEEGKDYKYFIYRYDINGDMIGSKPMVFSLNEGKEISSIRFTRSGGNDGYLISGTYSSNGESTEGLFTGRVSENGVVEFMKLHNLLDLEHFTDFMSERKQERIERRKEKAEARGKTLVYKGLATVHGFYYTNEKNYLVAEFYYPTYRTETYTVFVNGKATTQTRTVFDGYQYTHALVASVTDEGNLEWTNIFEMWVAYKPYSVMQLIRKNATDDGVLELSYANGSNMRFISFSEKGETLREKEVVFIETGKDDEVVKVSTQTNIQHWFDNYYVVNGYQKVKDNEREEGEKKRRKVYYFNLVKY